MKSIAAIIAFRCKWLTERCG